MEVRGFEPNFLSPRTQLTKRALTQPCIPFRTSGAMRLGSLLNHAGLLRAGSRSDGCPLMRQRIDNFRCQFFFISRFYEVEPSVCLPPLEFASRIRNTPVFIGFTVFIVYILYAFSVDFPYFFVRYFLIHENFYLFYAEKARRV